MEVLLAVTILLTGYLFLLGMFPVSFQGIGKARNLAFASDLAQQNLETFAQWYSNQTSNGFLSSAPVTPSGGWGTQLIHATVNGATVQTLFTWQVSGNYVSGTGGNVVDLVSWVRWREWGATNVSAPSGAPVDISGGYGAHFLELESEIYLP